MSGKGGPLCALCALSLTVATCHRPSPSQSSPASTAPVAVDGTPVSVELVARVARARGTTALDAARAIVRDELYARHLPETSPGVAKYLRAMGLARRMSERLAQDARAQGEVSAEELGAFTARHWWELDRPVTSRTTHVVVRVRDGEDPEPARELASKLHGELRDARTKERFREIANGFDAGDIEVKVEDLSPVAPDGRVIDLNSPPSPGSRTGTYASEFAQAANAIGEIGELSDVVRTDFGFHVILLTERIEEKRVPPAERRDLLRREVETARARKLEATLLARAKKATPVTVDQAALAQTEGLSVGQ